MAKRLPFPRKRDWHWRWMQTAGKTTLHRIVAGKRDEDWRTIPRARTACGLAGKFYMPGLLSRIGARRCGKCCDAVGVSRGSGAPYNQGVNA